MTSSPPTDRERAEDEAAAWLVLLSEQPNDTALRASFETWRTTSDLNSEIWARTSRAYGLIGQGVPRHREHWASYAASRSTHRDLPGVSPSEPPGKLAIGRHRLFSIRRLSITVAAGAIAAGLLVAVLPRLMLRMQADAMTGTGEVKTIALADGSKVSLAPESAIDVDFSADRRRIRLLKGEAFFAVRHDPTRPFSVTAGDAVITDIGTDFDVRYENNGAVVSVEQGRVHVAEDSTIPAVSQDLSAGMWTRVTWSGGVTGGSVPPDQIADWRQGELIAQDQPAGEVVDALRRYYPGIIIVRDGAFAAKRVSGIYDLRHPQETLHDLAASHGATVRQISPWLLIVTAE